MSFRKRNTVISTAASSAQTQTGAAAAPATPSRPDQQQPGPGVRPSPLDGRLTTSTGTASLDTLLAGHSGLPLGSSLLVEEQGTTDFAGALLRFYAAEGLVQGHDVHILGYGDAWKYALPGLAAPQLGSTRSGSAPAPVTAKSVAAPGLPDERMKIAWRYEALVNRNPPPPARDLSSFCHSFDLSKRLASSAMKGHFHALPCSSLDSTDSSHSAMSPLRQFIKHLRDSLGSAPPSSVHRAILPGLLSPSLYAGGSCEPAEVLQFLHSLRALLRLHARQLTVLLTLPVSLYPRSTGLTRWIELLCDGVIELVPLPRSLGPPAGATLGPSPSSSGGSDGANKGSKDADKIQGMVKVYTLPVYHEKGGGGAEGTYFRDNLAFSLSSSRGLVIEPYSLPPLEDEEKKEKSPATTVKDGIDF